MPGYPDSHLSSTPGPKARGALRRLLIAAPFVAVVLWFAYLWGVSGVLTSVEKYPGTNQIKSEGYLKRAGFGEYVRHGRWTLYHESGAKAGEGSYHLGEKQDDWQYWAPDGQAITAADAERFIDDIAEADAIHGASAKGKPSTAPPSGEAGG